MNPKTKRRFREAEGKRFSKSARRHQLDKPRIIHPVSDSSIRSGVFRALYAGGCDRCGKPVLIGQDVRRHHDFGGVVHDGCRSRDRSARRTAKPVITGKRVQTVPCPDCFEIHAGECP